MTASNTYILPYHMSPPSLQIARIWNLFFFPHLQLLSIHRFHLMVLLYLIDSIIAHDSESLVMYYAIGNNINFLLLFYFPFDGLLNLISVFWFCIHIIDCLIRFKILFCILIGNEFWFLRLSTGFTVSMAICILLSWFLILELFWIWYFTWLMYVFLLHNFSFSIVLFLWIYL